MFVGDLVFAHAGEKRFEVVRPFARQRRQRTYPVCRVADQNCDAVYDCAPDFAMIDSFKYLYRVTRMSARISYAARALLLGNSINMGSNFGLALVRKFFPKAFRKSPNSLPHSGARPPARRLSEGVPDEFQTRRRLTRHRPQSHPPPRPRSPRRNSCTLCPASPCSIARAAGG